MTRSRPGRGGSRRFGVAVVTLTLSLAFGSSCKKKVTSQQCDELIDRYAELWTREHFPDAGATKVAEERGRERTEAKADVFKNCTSEVQGHELECAMKAPTADAMVKCVE